MFNPHTGKGMEYDPTRNIPMRIVPGDKVREIAAKYKTKDAVLTELKSRVRYNYLQTDGNLLVPNSFEGDLVVLIAALQI